MSTASQHDDESDGDGETDQAEQEWVQRDRPGPSRSGQTQVVDWIFEDFGGPPCGRGVEGGGHVAQRGVVREARPGVNACRGQPVLDRRVDGQVWILPLCGFRAGHDQPVEIVADCMQVGGGHERKPVAGRHRIVTRGDSDGTRGERLPAVRVEHRCELEFADALDEDNAGSGAA